MTDRSTPQTRAQRPATTRWRVARGLPDAFRRELQLDREHSWWLERWLAQQRKS